MSDWRLLELLPAGWTLRRPPGGEGYCWRSEKIIDVGRDVPKEEEISLMLHEIAHLEQCCRDGHCVHWWERFNRLCVEHSVKPTKSDEIIAQVRGWA